MSEKSALPVRVLHQLFGCVIVTEHGRVAIDTADIPLLIQHLLRELPQEELDRVADLGYFDRALETRIADLGYSNLAHDVRVADGEPRYMRVPSQDLRFSRGDGYAGDAWCDRVDDSVFIVAVGHDPNLTGRRDG